VYCRPFEAAIRLAGLAGVKATYSEFEGEPVQTTPAVLTDLLRDRMGFTGTVVSDDNGIGWAHTRQLVASSGGKAGWYGDDLTEKEGGDTADIDLPRQQVALVEAVLGAGTPTVAVVAMARPQGLAAVVDGLPAILTCYYGGPHQGAALADALFGVTNPSGKLPVTIPRHAGQIPIHHGQRWGSGYRRTAADIHRRYLDMPSTPLFPFGHGLSDTTFDYGDLRLADSTVDVGGEILASLAVTNSGGRAGTEIVQLYAADTATGVTLPAQQLVGFTRVHLAPGETKEAEFAVPVSVLADTGMSGEVVMEPGPLELAAGSSSEGLRTTATVTVTGEARVVADGERAFLSAAEVGPG
jgi:beta-glucosidase